MNEVVAQRYRLLRRLAVGGMGEVHLAAQVGPAGYERVVALKRMLPTLVRDGEGLRHFLDEARLMTQLNHRNICQIVELGEDPQGYFVAMEFISGGSLLALLEKQRRVGQRLDPYYAVDIAAQIAEALAYAYTARGRDGRALRLIHRDVTPHNVLLSSAGDVKLIDFGIAKSTQQEHATQGAMVKGKTGYLSPEQSRGVELDGRSDLFSLGIMLYEMVSGTNPFAKLDLVATIMSIQSDLPAPLGMRNPAWLPLEPVIAKLMAKSPSDRYPDANTAAEALLDLRAHLPRPPVRLGAYVSERFAVELAELGQVIAQSQQPEVLDMLPTVPALRAAPPAPEPSGPHAADLYRPATLEEARASTATFAAAPPAVATPAPVPVPAPAPMPELPVGDATFEGDAPVFDDPPQVEEPVAAAEPPEVEEFVPEPVVLPAPLPPSGRSRVLWLVGLGVLGVGAIGGAMALRAPPPPVIDVPVTAPFHPAPPPPVEVAKPAARVPPSETKPAPAPPPAALEAEAPAKHGHRSKHGSDGPTLGSLTISGATHDLAQPSGHLDLADPSGHFQLGLDYALAEGALEVHLSSTPWALVSADGLTRGNTKQRAVDLPAMGATPVRVELEHPGLETIKLVMSFQQR